MNRKALAEQAFRECTAKEYVVHRGKKGAAPYRNTCSTQL